MGYRVKIGNDHMRNAPSARLILANREEKEAKLRGFIAEGIATIRASGSADATTVYTLVAKSADSPVAVALAAAAAQITDANLALRVVLLDTEGLAEDNAAASLIDSHISEIRVLQDQRFAAAHEQLTLGGNHLWIGDCMRRDPAKRDAFEMYLTGNGGAARHATASFAKLWAAAKPVKRMLGAGNLAPEVIVAGQSAGADTGGLAPRR